MGISANKNMRDSVDLYRLCDPVLKRKHEDNGRVRFLNQLAPAKSEVEYLKSHADEESRLRAVILSDYPYHMPEFEIALHTGMRPSEQYALIWSRVDLVRKLITIPKSKNGKTRHVPLNSIALAAFQGIPMRSTDEWGKRRKRLYRRNGASSSASMGGTSTCSTSWTETASSQPCLKWSTSRSAKHRPRFGSYRQTARMITKS
jgi:integrase